MLLPYFTLLVNSIQSLPVGLIIIIHIIISEMTDVRLSKHQGFNLPGSSLIIYSLITVRGRHRPCRGNNGCCTTSIVPCYIQLKVKSRVKKKKRIDGTRFESTIAKYHPPPPTNTTTNSMLSISQLFLIRF